jgi:hypothetical protein
MKIVISEEQLKTLVHLIKEDNGKINVMFVGDSLSSGPGYTWNYLLEKSHPDWDVTHVTKKGVKTSWMLQNFKTKLNEKKYDKVFIWGGTNDAFGQVSLDSAVSNIQSMVDAVVNQGGQAYVFIGYDAKSVMTDESLKTTIYCDKPCMLRGRDRTIELQEKVVNGIKNAIMVPAVVGSPSWTSDGVHVNGSAHKLFKDQVEKYIIAPTKTNIVNNTETNSGTNTETQSASQKIFNSIKNILSKKDKMESTATPEDIKTIQLSLNVINKGDLPMTGQINDETTKAIENYQETNNLDKTGKLSPDTTGGIISDFLFKITGKRYTFGKSSTTEKSEKKFNPMVIENPGVQVRTFPSDIESKFKNAVGDNYDSFISDVQAIGLDPKIAIRQLYTESAFSPDVMSCKRTSTAGAKGIAQFMPGTWPTYGGGGNPCNISDALKAYPKMMKELLKKFPGRLDLSIAAYNSGPYVQVPKNSKNYVYNNALKNKTPFTELKGVIPKESYGYASSILQP